MLRQLHALVVDDEPHCRDLLYRQLERTCPSITVLRTASSANEAERLIQDLAPDVVFMDIHMPHTSGLDLLESIPNRDDLQACARRILMHFYHHRTPGKGALSSAAQRLEILTSGKRHFVRHRDIVHIEAEGS